MAQRCRPATPHDQNGGDRQRHQRRLPDGSQYVRRPVERVEIGDRDHVLPPFLDVSLRNRSSNSSSSASSRALGGLLSYSDATSATLSPPKTRCRIRLRRFL